MRSGVRHHIFDALLAEWGVSKSLQLILLAAAAASIVVVIGANTIPNHILKKEHDNHEDRLY